MKAPKIHSDFIHDRISDEEVGLTYKGNHRKHRRFGEFYETVAFEDKDGKLWGETFLWSSEDGLVDAFWDEDDDGMVTLKPVEAYEIITGGYRIKE